MNIWQRAWRRISGESVSEPTVAEEIYAELEDGDTVDDEDIVPIEAPPEVEVLLVLKGQLPKDFPALDKLHSHGINTYGQLAKVENLKVIAGIGPKAAEKIANRLVEDVKNRE